MNYGGQSLAKAHPDVAATWHPTRNGKLTPDGVPPKTARKAWWRCAAGHEWEEAIATRTSLPQWKEGDVAACRQCSGFRVESAKRQAAYDERHARFEQDRQRLRDEAADAGDDVARIIEDLAREIPAGAPPPLVTDWRKQAARELKIGIARKRALGDTQAADVAVARVKGAARHIIPSIEKAAKATAHGRGVLEMHGRGHWAAGWLYWLTGKSIRPVDQEVTSATVTTLTSWLEQEAAHHAAIRAVAGGDAITTAQTTRDLTRAMVRAAAREAKPYRELTVPVLCGVSYGRLDVVIWHPAFPDVVIEIDSAHNPGSAKKLAFARDAGAIPIWVRFGEGRTNVPEGVTVIDLRTLGY